MAEKLSNDTNSSRPDGYVVIFNPPGIFEPTDIPAECLSSAFRVDGPSLDIHDMSYWKRNSEYQRSHQETKHLQIQL